MCRYVNFHDLFGEQFLRFSFRKMHMPCPNNPSLDIHPLKGSLAPVHKEDPENGLQQGKPDSNPSVFTNMVFYIYTEVCNAAVKINEAKNEKKKKKYMSPY